MTILTATALTDNEKMPTCQNTAQVAARVMERTSGEAAPAASIYDRLFPYHVELCALSELRKKPGFGAPLRSGMGGHALLYLHGVQLDPTAGYPVLRLCDPGTAPGADCGVGISVNAHYRNANWVAVQGREFLWRGALAPGERLTRAAYHRTQDEAKARDILAGVEFHPELFRAKPAGMSARDYMYEISVATDYAAQFGRSHYRACLPLDRARMGAIVDYLNALNQPYRAGVKTYRWKLFNDNCMHVARNALAAAGIWAPWPAGQSVLLAAFHFPVPKNGFVDLIRRANDLPIEDPQALYEDAAARNALLTHGALPTGPGGLALAGGAIAGNDIYDVARLRLIFFDNPIFGPYRFHFRSIFASPHYTDLGENLRHFSARFEAARLAGMRARGRGKRFTGARALFQEKYEAHIARQGDDIRRMLEQLGDEA